MRPPIVTPQTFGPSFPSKRPFGKSLITRKVTRKGQNRPSDVTYGELIVCGSGLIICQATWGEKGLVEAKGAATSRTCMLSRRVYARSGRGAADFVRQSDIDRVRYLELVLKLARQQGGSVSTHDVEELLHVHNKQVYQLLRKPVDAGKPSAAGSGIVDPRFLTMAPLFLYIRNNR